jgi:hypothetical protein
MVPPNPATQGSRGSSDAPGYAYPDPTGMNPVGMLSLLP